MQFLIYFLTSLTIFSALFAGMALALSAKEEIRPGKKYFILLQGVVLLSVIASFFAFYINIYLVYFIAVLLIFLLYFNYTRFKEIKPYVIYPALAIIFYLSSKKPSLFVVESSLMFLYGLPTGTLLTTVKSKKETIKRILPGIAFIAVALALSLIWDSPSLFS